jgi:hypothetical protein
MRENGRADAHERTAFARVHALVQAPGHTSWRDQCKPQVKACAFPKQKYRSFDLKRGSTRVFKCLVVSQNPKATALVILVNRVRILY